MDKGDSIREGENDVFEKYRATAQKIVSLFRQELPNELKNAVTGLGNTKFIKAPTPPGTRMPIPSMKTNNSGIYVADFDSDGKSDFVSFSTSAGTHIEISLPVAPPCEPDPLDMKVVEQYLRMFDD
ncbi:MAG: hypothetical protein KKD12_07845 [Proteobacteria bacterium]|nr:hypothetical protein [Pseudomonadota bacterium]